MSNDSMSQGEENFYRDLSEGRSGRENPVFAEVKAMQELDKVQAEMGRARAALVASDASPEDVAAFDKKWAREVAKWGKAIDTLRRDTDKLMKKRQGRKQHS